MNDLTAGMLIGLVMGLALWLLVVGWALYTLRNHIRFGPFK